jgi:pentatricopeptide repeat protein
MFNPPTGLCNMVLNCAARHGDAAMASDVLHYLTDSDIPLYEHHYAAMIEAYALSTSPNIPKIFATFESMQSAGILPHKHTVRAALPALSSREAADSAAVALLQNNTNLLASVELVMAAYAHIPDLTAAMQLYTNLPNLTSAKPTTHTVNILLSGCADTKNTELAMYLASEMRAMHLRPDAVSYEALVRVWSPEKEAFLYLEEMKAAGHRAGRRTYVDLVTKCVNAGDRKRAELVLREMAEVGWESDHVTRRLLKKGVRI